MTASSTSGSTFEQHQPQYKKLIEENFIHNTLDDTSLTWVGPRYQGKVRDVYDHGDSIVLVATDRQSAFDISWCSIPLKGQVLTQISNWWFQQVKDIVPTHVISSPDQNAVVAKKLTMFPLEVVVRAYMAGSTETSIWVNYQRGIRYFCGIDLPEGLIKNQPLPETIITPNTKGKIDEEIDSASIIKRGLATESQWNEISSIALKLFKHGQQIAAKHGLILVDTKYEFGVDEHGVITVGDEVHTPDSSRFWIAETYPDLHAQGKEPDSLDKEFFRRWLISAGFDPKLGEKSFHPPITDEVKSMLSLKYIELFERVTGERFVLPDAEPIADRMNRNLRAYFDRAAG